MNVRFARDYRHNYLILNTNGISAGSTYTIKMITENTIEGLLNCQERNINGETLLYYEITSKQNMKTLYDIQPLKIKQLQCLFKSLKMTGEMLENYLLHAGNLCLNPEYIFYDMQKDTYDFLFYPGESGIMEESFQELISFLMTHMDNEDMRIVEAVYQMADLLQKQQFVLDEVLIWFAENYGECPKREEQSSKPETNMDVEEQALAEVCSSEVEQPKKGFFQRIREKLFFCSKASQHITKKDIVYRKTYEYESPKEEETDEHTVYIPWVENSDNKLYGIGRGNKYHISLSHLPLTVGKMAGAVDMVIPESSVSRLHAKFSRQGTSFYITDLNSTNGTFRNGMRLEPNATERIEPGDEIGLGKLKFIYR